MPRGDALPRRGEVALWRHCCGGLGGKVVLRDRRINGRQMGVLEERLRGDGGLWNVRGALIFHDEKMALGCFGA